MRGRRAVALLAATLLGAGVQARVGAGPAPELPVPGPSATPLPSAPARSAEPGCTVSGTEGDDLLEGTEAPDVLCGLGGNDLLRGLGGNDDLRGGAGDDTLLGGAGDDRLSGEEGTDTVSFAEAPVGVAADLASGVAAGEGLDVLAGVERVVGSAFGDALHGTAGPDVLEGGGGVDLLYGREGDDVVDGGDGDDFLVGDVGVDDLRGGLGGNICHPMPDAGVETGCWGPQPRDPRDVSGPLDVRRVRTRLTRPRPIWRVATRSRWSNGGIWDRGYVVVLLDVRGGPEADLYAVARSTGRDVTATLYRVEPGRDRAVRGRVRAWRAGERSLSIRVALGGLDVDQARPYYRWGVRTLFTGDLCHRVCIDAVPGAPDLFPQPRV